MEDIIIEDNVIFTNDVIKKFIYQLKDDFKNYKFITKSTDKEPLCLMISDEKDHIIKPETGGIYLKLHNKKIIPHTENIKVIHKDGDKEWICQSMDYQDLKIN